MNKYTKNVKFQEKSSPKKGKAANPWVFQTILICTAMLAVIFAAMVMRISLNEKTEKLTRKAEGIRRQIEEKDREILNLRAERERLCSWENIDRKIQEYDLALRPTEYHQTKKMKRSEDMGPDMPASTAVAANERMGKRSSYAVNE